MEEVSEEELMDICARADQIEMFTCLHTRGDSGGTEEAMGEGGDWGN